MNPERDAVQPSQPDAAQQVSTAAPSPRGWPASAARLAQRDPAVALEIITAGQGRQPDASELLQLRQQALYQLMERHQLQDRSASSPTPSWREPTSARSLQPDEGT